MPHTGYPFCILSFSFRLNKGSLSLSRLGRVHTQTRINTHVLSTLGEIEASTASCTAPHRLSFFILQRISLLNSSCFPHSTPPNHTHTLSLTHTHAHTNTLSHSHCHSRSLFLSFFCHPYSSFSIHLARIPYIFMTLIQTYLK